MIGAFSESSFNRAKDFFGRFLHNQCIRLNPVEAELGKLITNMSRYISFAMANEFYMICDSYGANAHKVINACNKDYPRLNLPRPGSNVGGPCLYKDGYYLIDRIAFPDIIASAFKINESVTRYLLDKVKAKNQPAPRGYSGHGLQGRLRRHAQQFVVQAAKAAPRQLLHAGPGRSVCARVQRLQPLEARRCVVPDDAAQRISRLAKILKIVDNPDCVVCDMWNFWSENSELAHDGIYTAREALARLGGQEAIKRAA